MKFVDRRHFLFTALGLSLPLSSCQLFQKEDKSLVSSGLNYSHEERDQLIHKFVDTRDMRIARDLSAHCAVIRQSIVGDLAWTLFGYRSGDEISSQNLKLWRKLYATHPEKREFADPTEKAMFLKACQLANDEYDKDVLHEIAAFYEKKKEDEIIALGWHFYGCVYADWDSMNAVNAWLAKHPQKKKPSA